ncbi:glycosyl hydrolase [Echria macrotheca]|uniref:Glycosyl hydrolase n=1 Tax=Echria macrotheca TaxID=438768 RepID=A0AAJ0F4S2_9PEZI|nr:glycosyl hydrolase [Echria macrotheca]
MHFLAPHLLLALPSAAAKPYSTWMADSQIARGVTPTRWYTEATFYRGVEAVANLTSNATYLTFLTQSINAILSPNTTSSSPPFKGWDLTDHQLDNIRIGSPILFLLQTTHSPNPRQQQLHAAATFLHTQLVQSQPRTASGGFWHKSPKYPNQMWLDGLFMALPFYASYVSLFQPTNVTAWDDILLQFSLIEAHCRNQTSGLLKHGYDESRVAVWADPITGASPLVWIRAQGWYFMALVDVLEIFPRSHPGWERLRGWWVDLARALRREQDGGSGGWWLVMDSGYPGRAGNYIESSGTAMYTYGLLKGVRMGLFMGDGDDAEKYVDVARRAYGLMIRKFVTTTTTTTGDGLINWEGTVKVGSLDGRGDFNYYTGIPVAQNSLIGIGPFILASVDMERANLTPM